MKHTARNILKKATVAGILTAALGSFGKMAGKTPSKTVGLSMMAGLFGVQLLIATPAHAINEQAIEQFATAMNTAANSKNIAQVAHLIADDAIISLSRSGKTTNLDKESYLQLLQKSWAKAQDYRYDIDIQDVIISGNQARAQVITTESWHENGRATTIKTIARSTFAQINNKTVLLRLIAQVDVN